MKRISFLTSTALWIALATVSQAQMSTYPTPPSFAPPPDNGATDAKPAPLVAPDAGDTATAPEKKTSDSATPAAPPVTAAGLSSMSALDDKALLGIGDTVSFRVIEDRDAPVTRVVTDTGEVDFPYIGRVKVEGKTCHQVAVEVKKLLEVDYYKQATVIVGLDLILGQDKSKAKEMAWVVGEVKQVGPIELTKVQPVTVSQAIMRLGGFGDFADQRKVKLVHRTGAADSSAGVPANIGKAKDFQLIDVKSIFEGKSTSDPVLVDGDYVIVPKQFVHFN